MATITRSNPPPSMARSAAWARLAQPEMMAHSCSPSSRSMVLDRAIEQPSDDTATAPVTPAVSSTKWLSSQLKLRHPRSASSALLAAPGVAACFVEAALHAARQVGQELAHLGRRRWTPPGWSGPPGSSPQLGPVVAVAGATTGPRDAPTRPLACARAGRPPRRRGSRTARTPRCGPFRPGRPVARHDRGGLGPGHDGTAAGDRRPAGGVVLRVRSRATAPGRRPARAARRPRPGRRRTRRSPGRPCWPSRRPAAPAGPRAGRAPARR